MAQIDFFLCKDEKIELVNTVIELGGYLIPDLPYPNKSYSTIENLTEYEKYVNTNILLFIVHPESFKYRLSLGSFEKEGKKTFFIEQRHGGPTIDFYSPGLVEYTDQIIGSGF